MLYTFSRLAVWLWAPIILTNILGLPVIAAGQPGGGLDWHFLYLRHTTIYYKRYTARYIIVYSLIFYNDGKRKKIQTGSKTKYVGYPYTILYILAAADTLLTSDISIQQYSIVGIAPDPCFRIFIIIYICRFFFIFLFYSSVSLLYRTGIYCLTIIYMVAWRMPVSWHTRGVRGEKRLTKYKFRIKCIPTICTYSVFSAANPSPSFVHRTPMTYVYYIELYAAQSTQSYSNIVAPLASETFAGINIMLSWSACVSLGRDFQTIEYLRDDSQTTPQNRALGFPID